LKARWIGAGLAALAALIWVVSLSGGDERALRKALRNITQDLEKEGPEKLWTAERRADRIARRFTEDPDVQSSLSGLSFESRTDLRAMVFRARATAERIRARVDDVEIRVDPGRKTATLTGTARVTLTGSGETGDLFQEFETGWVREEDGWLIATVRMREAIRRPGS
jgi:hypothetical protein